MVTTTIRNPGPNMAISQQAGRIHKAIQVQWKAQTARELQPCSTNNKVYILYADKEIMIQQAATI